MVIKSNEVIISDEIIMNKIYYIRDQKVMIDSDLAELYEVENKQLKRQVKRNIERFPMDFMFELTQTEYNLLRSQIGTSNIGRGGTRYLPIVFTEQGVAMLSSILNSKKAIIVNIQIIRIFTRIRQILVDTTELKFIIENIRKTTDNNTNNIELVFQYLDELTAKKENQKPIRKIGYKIPKKSK